MSKTNKKYIVPSTKPRNTLISHPLMKRGGVMEKSEKSIRHMVNIRLSQLTKEPKPDEESYDQDDYGLDV